MEYYLLQLSKNVKKPLKPYAVDESDLFKDYKLDGFGQLPDLTVAYFNYDEWHEITDFLNEPIVMISDKMKSVIERYNKSMKFKGVQLYANYQDTIIAPLFWITNFESVDCLHQETQFYPNKWLKTLVLDKEKIEGRHIFQVDGIFETKIVVELRLCEAILRHQPVGIEFEKVVVK